jgi:hypothetical protein
MADIKRICREVAAEGFEGVDPSAFQQKCMETVADIAMTAGYMLANGEIRIEDSRELVRQIIKWAENFEVLHLDNEWNEITYIEAVDEYAEALLLEHYGVDRSDEKSEAECQ